MCVMASLYLGQAEVVAVKIADPKALVEMLSHPMQGPERAHLRGPALLLDDRVWLLCVGVQKEL